MTLPHSEEAEAALVSRLLVDPRQVAVLSGRLSPDDFYVGVYRDAWAAMVRMSATHTPIDLVTLRAEGVDITGVDLVAGSRAPVEEYAGIIRGLAFRRRAITNLERLTARVYEADDRQAVVSDIQATVTAIMEGVEDGRLFNVAQAIELYEAATERRARQGSGLSYGIEPMDRLIQPAQGGDMIVIAGRPSMGKTALAETIADNWAWESPAPVMFVSLEMSLSQLMDRAIARTRGIDAQRVIRGLLNPDEQVMAREALDARRAVNIWYLDDPNATTASIRAAAAKVRLVYGGLRAIVIDYLQLLTDAGDQEVQRVTRISRRVKAIAREFDVPVVALSQLRRFGPNEAARRPRLDDLRESGAIEQDADLVMALWGEGLDARDVELLILKNRQGMAEKTIYLSFDRSTVTFGEETA